MSNARHCITCNKKYYPKAWNSYPEDSYYYENGETTRFVVRPQDKRFHSLGCMKEWIAINSIDYANLVDSISYNKIQDINNNQTIEKG